MYILKINLINPFAPCHEASLTVASCTYIINNVNFKIDSY